MICPKCRQKCIIESYYQLTEPVPIYECSHCTEFYVKIGKSFITTLKEIPENQYIKE